jgi:glycosyltransferase involved in cell wall biosynthesis
MRLAWNLRRYEKEVRKLVLALDPLIIQGMWVPTDGYLAARTGCHPLVIASFVTDVIRKPKVSRRLYERVGWTLGQADRIVMDCNWVRDEIRRTYPDLAEERFCVFPRGVELERYHPELSRPPEGREVPIIFCNRAFEPVYDHETLFRALDLLPTGAEFGLMLAGEGGLKSICEKRVGDARWAAQCRFVGRLSSAEISRHLRRSDIYVSCALQDGTSVSLLEALASGLPCVVTDLPSNREWIEDGKCGVLFPVRDANSLAGKMATLLGDAPLRERIGANAVAVARARADWAVHRQTLLGLYEGLIS